MDAAVIGSSSNEWMDLEEFRTRVGMGRTAVYEAARKDELPVKVRRFGKRYLISRVEYEAVLSGSQNSATSA